LTVAAPQREGNVMNELFVLLDTARSIAWVAFGATLLVAAGLAIFDGRKPAQVEHRLEVAPERKAA
jgi:hypothetical protein